MKLNDSTKTVGSLIAVLLIPLAVIGWNFYSTKNNEVIDDDLSVIEAKSEELSKESSQNEVNEDGFVTNSNEEKDTLNKNDPDSKGIGEIKTLPGTSSNPIAEDEE